ncbi:Sporulation related domain-containing protein [Paenibacillaceae bacterium GAS479]|nr:Sporulation related domain-containing protein [Paenibacillaceae bacterium GAS479]
MTKARVTYRPDGSGKLVQEGNANSSPNPRTAVQASMSVGAAAGSGDRHAETELSALQFTEEYKPWSSPFQDSIDELELLIREENAGSAEDDHEEAAPQEIWLDDMYGDARDEEARSTSKYGEAIYEEARQIGKYGEAIYDEALMSAEEYNEDALYLHNYSEADYGEVELDPQRHSRSELWERDRITHNGPILELEAARPARRRGAILAFISGKSGERNQGPSWLMVLISVVGAIATGAVFGYFTLTMFAGGSLISGSDSGASANIGGVQAVEQGESATAPASSGPAKQGAVQDAKPVTAAWPAQSYQLLQYGVFSSKSSAETAAADLKEAGFASALSYTGTDYRVYAGLAIDQKGAKALKDKLTGTEVYIKEVKLPGVEQLVFTGSAEAARGFDARSSELIRSLEGLSAAQLVLDKPTPVGAQAMSAWNTKLEAWLTEASSFRTGVSGKATKAAADTLVKAFQGASTAMNVYNKAPSINKLWAVQSKLIEAMLAQRELRQAAISGAKG